MTGRRVVGIAGAAVLAVMSGAGLASAPHVGTPHTQTQAATAPDGGALYRAYCASCHGTSGRGDGPVAEFLRVPPTDLTTIAQRAGNTFPAEQVHRAIDGRQRVRGHGSTDMPVWGDTLSPSLAGRDAAETRRRIEALVAHIASIQQRIAEASAPSPASHTR